MTTVLGLLPILGREPLALHPFGKAPVFVSALRVLAEVARSPVFVVTGEQPAARFEGAVRGRVPAFDLVGLPRDEQLLRAVVAQVDVVVVHDPLCPLVPAGFIRALVERAVTGESVVAVRPVVDTVKSTSDRVVTGTVDRQTLRIVSSPVAVPADRLASLPDLPAALRDAVVLLEALRRQGEVTLETAPSTARRIEDAAAIDLVSSIDAVSHRLRER